MKTTSSDMRGRLVAADWFIRARNDKDVRAALGTVLRERFDEVIRRRLDENRDNHQEPSSIIGLCRQLELDPANFRRRTGVRTGLHEFLALAATLRITIAELYPSKLEWISQASIRLTGDQMTLQEADLFARYCLRCVAQGEGRFGVDEGIIRQVADEVEQAANDVEKQVRHAMTALAEQLPKDLVGEL